MDVNKQVIMKRTQTQFGIKKLFKTLLRDNSSDNSNETINSSSKFEKDRFVIDLNLTSNINCSITILLFSDTNQIPNEYTNDINSGPSWTLAEGAQNERGKVEHNPDHDCSNVDGNFLLWDICTSQIFVIFKHANHSNLGTPVSVSITASSTTPTRTRLIVDLEDRAQKPSIVSFHVNGINHPNIVHKYVQRKPPAIATKEGVRYRKETLDDHISIITSRAWEHRNWNR